MSTYSLADFNQQINEILKLIDTTDVEAKNIKERLFQSAYINLMNKFMPELKKLDSQQSQNLLRELQGIDNLNHEDEKFEVGLQKIKGLIMSLDFDFQEELAHSAEEVMSDFVKKISKDLAPEEVEKIKAIFS